MGQKSMRVFAGEIMGQLREDKEKGTIGRIYGMDFVAAGDKVRMKLALAAPAGYYGLVRVYDKFVVPFRVGMRKALHGMRGKRERSRTVPEREG